MPGVKRKDISVSGIQNGSSKKPKTGPPPLHRPKAPIADLETATDSDPIVESDTTEHSGDDDGVSWPSDDEDQEESPASRNDNPDKKVPQRQSAPKKDSKPQATTKQSDGLQSKSGSFRRTCVWANTFQPRPRRPTRSRKP